MPGHSGRGVQDVELERVEDQVGAEPDVGAVPRLQVRPDRAGQLRPGRRVGPVRGDDQVVLGRQRPGVRGRGAEPRPYPQVRAPLLEDGEQPVPAHRGEAVPARGQHRAVVVHVDVVPAGELALHRAVDLRVGMLDAAQGLVREHHAEAERVVGRVALPDGDLAVRGELLGERREIQPSRPAAHDRDPHRASPIGTRPPARHPRVGFTLCRFCDDRQYSASSGHAPAPCHRPAPRRHASGGLTSSGAD